MVRQDILSLAAPRFDLREAYGGAAEQFGEWRWPKVRAGAPVLMVIHGGYWRAQYDLRHAGHLCAALTSVGLATFNLEYRRVGNWGGGWPGTFEDVVAGYRFLRQRHGDRVFVLGHSAGGQLALALAAHQAGVAGVVSLAGVLDLVRGAELHLSHDAVVEFLGGTLAAVPEHYAEASPLLLGMGKVPQRVIYGEEDDVVPPGFSRDYVTAKKARGESVVGVGMAGAGHFDLIDPRSRAWAVVAREVEAMVRAR